MDICPRPVPFEKQKNGNASSAQESTSAPLSHAGVGRNSLTSSSLCEFFLLGPQHAVTAQDAPSERNKHRGTRKARPRPPTPSRLFPDRCSDFNLSLLAESHHLRL